MRGLIHTLVADPPWKFGDKLPGASRGAGKNYRVLTLDEIRFFLEENGPEGVVASGSKILSFADMLADDCRLFLWRVSSMQQEALNVVKAWGFELKTELVWRKLTSGDKPWFGMGRTFRGSHETCLVASRGRPVVLSHSVRSVYESLMDPAGDEPPTVFDAKVLGHSVKPDGFYKIVEALSSGPHLELFARRRREGWHSFGEELAP